MARLAFGLLAAGLIAGVFWLASSGGPDPAPDPAPREESAHAPQDEAPDLLPPSASPTLDVAPRAAAPRAPTPQVLAPGSIVVSGRVQTAVGAPAAQASVSLILADQAVDNATTDADAAFRCVVPPNVAPDATHASLRIRHVEGAVLHLVAIRAAPNEADPGTDIDAGLIRLLAVHPVDVHVESDAPKAATVWIVPPALWRDTTWWDTKSTDATGNVRFDAVPAGAWRVVATVEDVGRGEGFAHVPVKRDVPVRVTIQGRAPLHVTVTDQGSGAPVVGATCALTETVTSPTGNYGCPYFPRTPLPPTNAQGITILRGLAAKPLSLAVHAQGYPTVSAWQGVEAAAIVSMKPDRTEVAVQLTSPRSVRWPLEAGEVPVPADGTVIEILPLPGNAALGLGGIPSSGTVQGGELVVDGWGRRVHAMARTPEGALARLWAKDQEERGPSITFIPARAIQVSITFSDGSPAAGYHVRCANQGNNLIASAVTDENGHARMGGLYGGPRSLVEVRASTTASRFGGSGKVIATVDLSKGDASVKGTVERAVPVVVSVSIDGTPGIPKDLALDPGSFGPARGLRLRIGMVTQTDKTAELDRDAGEVRFTWEPQQPPTHATLYAQAPGYQHASHTVTFTGGELRFSINFVRAGALTVDVKVPANGRVRVNLERWDDEGSAWKSVRTGQMAMGGYAKPDANGRLTLEPLTAGRYRVVDRMNGVVGAPVRVREGGTAHASLDLGTVGIVKGRVDVPEGENPAGVLVVLEGGPAFWQRPWVGRPHVTPRGAFAFTGKGGEFQLRVPGDRPVTLRPHAPTLVPAPGGTETLTKPREDVVLRLAHGALATVHFADPLGARRWPMPFGIAPTCPVLLYRDAVKGEPVARLEGALTADGDRVSFSHFEPGAYTIWIDADSRAPVTLADVELTAGKTELRAPGPDPGATLVLDLLLPDGQDAPRISLWPNTWGHPPIDERPVQGRPRLACNSRAWAPVASGCAPGARCRCRVAWTRRWRATGEATSN